MVLFTSSIRKMKGAAHKNCDVDGTCKPALITVRKRSFGKVMFSQACVKNSVHRGVRGRCTYPLPPARQMPPGQTPPLGRHPPPWADTPRSDGHCSGRYASYWNAFLYCIVWEHGLIQSPKTGALKVPGNNWPLTPRKGLSASQSKL